MITPIDLQTVKASKEIEAQMAHFKLVARFGNETDINIAKIYHALLTAIFKAKREAAKKKAKGKTVPKETAATIEVDRLEQRLLSALRCRT